MAPVIVRLPTDLVARYRAVDREHIWAPAYVVDTPAHLDALTEDVGKHGILVPLSLTFNGEFGALDGNHRIAVALRLGLSDVPVSLTRVPEEPRPAHAKSMAPSDLAVIESAYDLAVSGASPGQREQTAGDEDRRSG